MINFCNRKIGINDVHEIYMIHLKESPNGRQRYVNIVPITAITANKSFCHTTSKATAEKTCQILKSITICQDPKNWKRQTLKRVQQIVRLMNRINHYGHTCPIPFENLEKILGWELAALVVTESYKKQIAMYKLEYDEMKKTTCGYWKNDTFVSTDHDRKKHLLKNLTHWVTDPIGYIYDSEKGEYQKNPYNSENNPPLFSTLDL